MRKRLLIEFAISVFIVGLPFLSGCSTEQRAVRQVAKVQGKYPWVIASACVSYYPTQDSVHESVIYKEGQVIEKKVPQYVMVDCDSVVSTNKLISATPISGQNKVRIPCPPCDSMRVDTVEHYKYEAKQNTAKLDVLQHKYDEQSKLLNTANETIASDKTKLHLCYWIIGVLGIYTIGRWVLRLTTGFKLP